MKDSKCVSINVFYLALRKTSCPLSCLWACAHTEDPTGSEAQVGCPSVLPSPYSLLRTPGLVPRLLVGLSTPPVAPSLEMLSTSLLGGG